MAMVEDRIADEPPVLRHAPRQARVADGEVPSRDADRDRDHAVDAERAFVLKRNLKRRMHE